jgi:hypothetical protein
MREKPVDCNNQLKHALVSRLLYVVIGEHMQYNLWQVLDLSSAIRLLPYFLLTFNY